jgi:ferredoxin-NADP reductase
MASGTPKTPMAARLESSLLDQGDQNASRVALTKVGLATRLAIVNLLASSSGNGEPMLYSPGGFIAAVRQALDKLGVAWEPTKSERDYNEGRSTQIPVNPVVRIKGRFSRQLRYRNARLILERATGSFA